MSANATLFIALVIVFLKYLIHLVLWCFQFKDEISFLQILVVQEKSGLFKGTGVWKIPTGVVDEVCT